MYTFIISSLARGSEVSMSKGDHMFDFKKYVCTIKPNVLSLNQLLYNPMMHVATNETLMK